MNAPALYARVVASFDADAPPAVVDAVIELARRLGAEVQAVMLEDALALAGTTSRAFDPRSAVWRELQSAQLQHELDIAASLLRRRLEGAQAVGVQARFSVVQGGPAAALQGLAQAGDLLVVAEPSEPMARWVQPFAGLLQAALAAPAALLYLPRQMRSRDAPIAALGADGTTRALAQRLAQALGTRLLALGADEGASMAVRASLLVDRLPQLRASRVQLVVCSREALAPEPRRALHDAGDQRVAVLLAPAEVAE